MKMALIHACDKEDRRAQVKALRKRDKKSDLEPGRLNVELLCCPLRGSFCTTK